MKKTRFVIIQALILFILANYPALSWADDEAEDLYWSAKTGVKEVISTGLYGTSAYTRPYAGAETEWNHLSLAVSGAGLLRYPLYDAGGNDKNVNLYQLTATGGVVDFYYVSAFLQYGWSAGASEYKRHDVSAVLELSLDSFYVNGEYAFSKNTYDYNGSLDSKTYSWSVEAGCYITDSFSVDMGYANINNTSYAMALDYTRRSLRAGMSVFITDNIFTLAGLSYGWDTIDYNIYAADMSLGVIIAEHVKLSGMYLVAYNDGPGIESKGTRSGTTSSSTLESGSYFSQNISLGAELRL